MAREEGEEEDIVERLEALRKRAPRRSAEEGEPERGPAAPPEPPGDDRRRRIYRIVGFGVIAIVLIGVIFAGYTRLIVPMQKEEVEKKVEEERQAEVLAKGKGVVRGKIFDAFSGLPEEYRRAQEEMLQRVEGAGSIDELKAIDYEASASREWREYTQDLLGEKAQVIGRDRVLLRVENSSFKGYKEALAALPSFGYRELRGATIEEVRNLYVPVRLSREQAAGGFFSPGDYVNIYYTDENTTVVARDARVITYLRATTSISLSESESRIVSGQGGEAKGEGSISSGGVSSLTGPISIGVRRSSSSTSYSVDISQVQKAAAASKLEEDYIRRVLSNYGIKLTQIEMDAKVGNLEEEYLLLLKMSEGEAEALISKATSDKEREKLRLAISRPSSWMEK